MMVVAKILIAEYYIGDQSIYEGKKCAAGCHEMQVIASSATMLYLELLQQEMPHAFKENAGKMLSISVQNK